jgi:hypothetical protein
VDKVICIGPQDRGFLAFKRGGSAWLEDRLDSHAESVVPLSLGATDHKLELPCCTWGVLADGAHLWVSLPGIHRGMSLHVLATAGVPQWLYKGKQAWAKYIQSLGLKPTHLRWSLASAWERGAETLAASSGETHDCLPWAGASSHALLALALKWSGGGGKRSGALQHPEDVAAMTSLLDALIWIATAGRSLELDIFMGDAQWEPPEPPSGRYPAKILVADGAVHLAPLRGPSLPYSSVVASLLQDAGPDLQMPVGILLHRLSSHASQGIWLLRQFVWQLGSGLDGKLAAASWDHRLEDDRQHSDVLLARYFLASRKALKSCRVLHVALDASRVGNRNLMSTAAALPPNIAAWCPPQAISENTNHKKPDPLEN